ncbi:uncharacterized protein LOC62_04G006435 [Vanrija pseudolonga]|uniref:Golgi to ER traffic protein 2 n=1 Tax=Vanrija pseudolonga TaxID=143232 RepID=A0AAF0YAB1_9TREE|nr:hypothetical protein LOC62_04G006435 [Vanrija pseudolonga]
MSDAAAPLTDAQKRAAARKAKILARGNAGLARLAQTARGEDADKLYGEGSTPVSPASASATATSPTSPSAASPTSPSASATSPSAPSARPGQKPSWAPTVEDEPVRFRPPRRNPNAPAGAGGPQDEAMRQQIENMMAMLGANGPAGPAGAAFGGLGPDQAGAAPPDMANFMAALMGGGGFPGGPGGPGGLGADGPGLIGDGSDTPTNPFASAAGGDPFGGQNPFAALGGANPFAGLPGMAGPPAPPTRAQRLFPTVHFVAVLALVVFIAGWWEPSLASVRHGAVATLGGWAHRWAGLAGRVAFGAKLVESIPVFYAFVTLQLILLATRVTIIQTPPALHPLLANVLPMLPRPLATAISTGSKYLGVVSQSYKDACLLVFGLGAAIVLAEYLDWRGVV